MLNSTKEKLIAIALFTLVTFTFTGIAVALDTGSTGPKEKIAVDVTEIVTENNNIVSENIPETTTTTIDLSFLNTTTTTAPPPPPPPPVEPNFAPGDSVWDALAQCESGGNWAYPPVSGGFSGGIMFHIGTWRAQGGLEFAPDAYLASREEQIVIAERTLASGGWGQWPGCSRKLGLR